MYRRGSSHWPQWPFRIRPHIRLSRVVKKEKERDGINVLFYDISEDLFCEIETFTLFLVADAVTLANQTRIERGSGLDQS